MDSFVSFKTILYVFYFFILLVSQVLIFNTALAGESLNSFILANNYGIVLLIAFDKIIKEFSRDRKEMTKNSDEIKQALAENQD